MMNMEGANNSSRGTFNRGGRFDRGGLGGNFSQGHGVNNGGRTFHASRRSSTVNEESNNRGGFSQSSRRFYPAENVMPTIHASRRSSTVEESNNRGGFSKPRRPFYKTNVLPNGQVEIRPVAPVAVRVLPEDKEEFGEEIEKVLANHVIPRSHALMGFAPMARTVDEIYAEDEKHAEEYATVADEDDEVRFDKELNLTFIETWDDLAEGFDQTVIENVKRAKYIKPRKIQRSALPFVMDGWDCIVSAETGSGKSATFLIPMINACIQAKAKGEYVTEPFTPYAIILAPTRELVTQTYEQCMKLADRTNVVIAKAYGEYDVRKNKRELHTGCNILVATPGRFHHFASENYIKLHKVKMLVFDEGDRLLDVDFRRTIDEALFGLENKISDERQTLFFSATFEKPLIEAAKQYMRPEFTITIQGNNTAPTKKVVQEFRLCKGAYKFGSVLKFLKEELQKVNDDVKMLPRTFIFCKTGDYCEKLAIALVTNGIPCIPLHGYRGQDLREEALSDFRNNECAILVVTDLCARGIDIKDVDLVINCNMPDDYETYVHRAGRAGRIRHGTCVSFVSLGNDKPLLLQIKKTMEESGQIIPPSLEEMLRPEGIKERQNNETSSVANVEDKAEDVVATLDFSGHKEENELGMNEAVAAAADNENIKPFAPIEDDHASSEVPHEEDPTQDEEDFAESALENEGTAAEIAPVMEDDHYEVMFQDKEDYSEVPPEKEEDPYRLFSLEESGEIQFDDYPEFETSFASTAEAEPEVEEKHTSSVPTVEAEPEVEENAAFFAQPFEAEPEVEEKAASSAPPVEAEPEVEENAAFFAQPFEAEPEVEENAAFFAQPFEAEPLVEEKAESSVPTVEAEPDVEEKAASFALIVDAEPLVEEKAESSVPTVEAEPEVEENAESFAPPVEAQPDVEEKAGLPPAKEVVKVPATEDVPSTTPQVPAQVVQCDSAFEDLIQKMKIAMKEAGIADEVIEDTVTAARAKHHVAAADAPTHQTSEPNASADSSTEQASPSVPEPKGSVPSMPPVFQPRAFDSYDDWE